MEIKVLNKNDAQQMMTEWQSRYPDLPEVDSEWAHVRSDLQNINRTVRQQAEKLDTASRADYYIDLHMGLELYDYLWKMTSFSMRYAADDGFWRFLSVQVAPDVVAQRWGRDNADHFWRMPTRIWFRAIWWYIHLSWQGDVQSTGRMLENPRFTTDTILNFVERTGRRGTAVDVFRCIIYCYSQVITDDLKRFGRSHKGQDDLFRVVMKLNTARMMVVEPALCLGGERAYAESLFQDVGVALKQE